MSTIQVKKSTMGYSTAISRPRCANCANREGDRTYRNEVAIRCKKGGFMTAAWAMCDQYQPEKEQENP
jgi:hypothetical protein